MNFGKWIVVAFIGFAIFIASLVTICVREDVNLVRNDYYAVELMHQQKMERIANAKSLSSKPEIMFQQGHLSLSFDQLSQIENGRIWLQRPSDSNLDEIFEVSPGISESQNFQLKRWNRGLYRVSFEWKMNGKEYYMEKTIIL